MNDVKYIGLDVHQATISAALRDSTGKLVMEAILPNWTNCVFERRRTHTKVIPLPRLAEGYPWWR
jgi:hypothetical protein